MAVGAVGVGSGLDLEGLINKLIAAERTPKLNSLAAKEATIQANISAFGGLKSVLDQFKSGLAGLLDAEALQARTASSSVPAYFSASAESTALAGQYDVQVLNLAKAHKLVSTANFASSTDTVGAGTLNISSGGSSFQVTTTATTTLAELEGLINSATGNTGVTASLIVVAADPLDAGAGTLTRLVLNGTSTGAANAIGIAVNDSDGNHTDNQGLSRFYFSAADLPGSQLAQQQAALDARIAVDGFTAFSSTNSFSSVIAGVTITAQREPTDPLAPESAQLTVAQDRAQLTSKVQAFVKSYNEVRARSARLRNTMPRPVRPDRSMAIRRCAESRSGCVASSRQAWRAPARLARSPSSASAPRAMAHSSSIPAASILHWTAISPT